MYKIVAFHLGQDPLEMATSNRAYFVLHVSFTTSHERTSPSKVNPYQICLSM